MDADFSVELGAEDATLDFPWEAEGTPLRYYDVRRQPELLRFIDEAEKYHELRDFLAAVNSAASLLETAKCDTWVERELSEAEDIYHAELKFVSYVDLVFASSGPAPRSASGAETPSTARTDFPTHERMVKRLAEMLGRAPRIQSAAEFIIRRCYFRDSAEPVSGYYVTFYLSGYGLDDEDARRRWGIGLNVVQNALLQLSAEFRREKVAG